MAGPKASGGQGQVKEAISREFVGLFQGLEAGRQGPVIFGSPRPQGLKKEAVVAPGVGVPRLRQPGRGQGLPGQGPKAVIPQVSVAGDPHQEEAPFQAVLLTETVEGGQELTAHQVAGGAEGHEQVRFDFVVGHRDTVSSFR